MVLRCGTLNAAFCSVIRVFLALLMEPQAKRKVDITSVSETFHATKADKIWLVAHQDDEDRGKTWWCLADDGKRRWCWKRNFSLLKLRPQVKNDAFMRRTWSLAYRRRQRNWEGEDKEIEKVTVHKSDDGWWKKLKKLQLRLQWSCSLRRSLACCEPWQVLPCQAPFRTVECQWLCKWNEGT